MMGLLPSFLIYYHDSGACNPSEQKVQWINQQSNLGSEFLFSLFLISSNYSVLKHTMNIKTNKYKLFGWISIRMQILVCIVQYVLNQNNSMLASAGRHAKSETKP